MRTPFCFIISFPPDTKGSFLFEYIISLFILKNLFFYIFLPITVPVKAETIDAAGIKSTDKPVLFPETANTGTTATAVKNKAEIAIRMNGLSFILFAFMNDAMSVTAAQITMYAVRYAVTGISFFVIA